MGRIDDATRADGTGEPAADPAANPDSAADRAASPDPATGDDTGAAGEAAAGDAGAGPDARGDAGDAAVSETADDSGEGVSGSSDEVADEGGDGVGEVEGGEDVDELDVPRRGRTALAVSLVVAVLAVAFVWVLATREPATDRQASSPLIGEAAPAVSGRTLDGGSFDIDDHQGRWVVLNFFATWCVPCQREHPELVAFDEAHRAAGDARVVSVLYDDSPDDAREYFARNGGEWPVVLDERGIANDYGVTGVPETYLVAPNGRVAAKLIGGVTQDGLDNVIGEIEAAAAGSGASG